MNNMYSFNPEEKRQRMAQALENYILPEQKVQMFNQLAQSYGINLGGQVQPQDQLMQQLYTVNQEVATIKQTNFLL